MDSPVNSESIAAGARHVIVVCGDLYFRVHLDSQIRAAGMVAVPVATAAAAREITIRGDLHVRGAVIDLGWNGGDPVDVISGWRRAGADFPILAFGAHVERDRLAAARSAGAVSMPRSRFVREYGGFLHALSLGLAWPDAATAAAEAAGE